MGLLVLTELRRIYRSPRFLIFTVGFPVVYFLLFTGILSAFGAIAAAISTGGRVAVERSIGWNRQLRLTPLPSWNYVAAKAAVSMVVALPALVLVFVLAATLKGVDLSALVWVRVFLAAWLGVLPFAAIGLFLGLIATADSAQGMSTVTMLLFTLLGGVLIPAQVLPPAAVSFAHVLPSYWLSTIAIGQANGESVPVVGLAVLLAWLVVVSAAVAVRYRRDALRV